MTEPLASNVKSFSLNAVYKYIPSYLATLKNIKNKQTFPIFAERDGDRKFRQGQFDSSVTRPQVATTSLFLSGVLLVTSHSSTDIQTDSASPS
nr:unnamed protein product [Callosobruchus chinensis]